MMQQKNIYPNSAYKNMGKMLDILKKIFSNYLNKNILKEHSKIFYEIVGRYEEIKDSDDYEFYSAELDDKFDNIIDRAKNGYCIWNINELNASIRFDCLIMMNMKSSDVTFYNNVVSYCVNNKNFIYFIKKLLMRVPDLLKDKEIKNRIMSILELNSQIAEEEKEAGIINFTLINNIDKEKCSNDECERLYEEFIIESSNLLDKLLSINIGNYKENFENSRFVTYYNLTYLEKQFIGNNEINYENETLLKYVYQLIENNKNYKFYDLNMKRRIIEIMSRFREKYPNDKEFLTEYNKYLCLLNSSEAKGLILDDLISKNKLKKEKFDLWESNREGINTRKIKKGIFDSLNFDYEVLKSFVCSDEEYEKYREEFVLDHRYPESILKMLKENENMFNNKIICCRAVQILSITKELFVSKDKKYKEFYKKNNKVLKYLNNKHFKGE